VLAVAEVGSSSESSNAVPSVPPSWLVAAFLGRRSAPFAKTRKVKGGSVALGAARERDEIMGKKLFVGNLSYSLDETQLGEIFGEFGTVESVAIVNDRETGRSRGFGFVEMANDAEAQAAIDALNGAERGGRAMTVNEARPRDDRPRRPGGGGGGGGGFKGGGGGGGGFGGGNRRRGGRF
jgi:cold-inducible RNA-binding protein